MPEQMTAPSVPQWKNNTYNCHYWCLFMFKFPRARKSNECVSDCIHCSALRNILYFFGLQINFGNQKLHFIVKIKNVLKK